MIRNLNAHKPRSGNQGGLAGHHLISRDFAGEDLQFGDVGRCLLKPQSQTSCCKRQMGRVAELVDLRHHTWWCMCILHDLPLVAGPALGGFDFEAARFRKTPTP
jgi:hypothetical protein